MRHARVSPGFESVFARMATALSLGGRRVRCSRVPRVLIGVDARWVSCVVVAYARDFGGPLVVDVALHGM